VANVRANKKGDVSIREKDLPKREKLMGPLQVSFISQPQAKAGPKLKSSCQRQELFNLTFYNLTFYNLALL
jgi:hypothetical protein